VPELLDVARRIAAMAGPGEQVEAYVARGRSTTVRAHSGEVESLTQASSAGIGVRVIVDRRQGFAQAGTLDEAAVLEVLGEARDNARFTEPDEWIGLAPPDGVAPPELDAWSEALEAMPPETKVDAALALEAATRAGDPRITGVRTAIWSDATGEAAVASSTGIEVWDRGGTCHVAVQALAADGGSTQTGYGLAVGRDPDEVDVEAAAADAVLRATRLLGATKPPTSRVTLVLEPRMTATLLGLVGGMLSGAAVLKGRSPFAGRVGEQVASPLLTLVDDPTDQRSLGAERHDGEGLACRRVELLSAGELQGYLHDSYTGRRSGAASTGSAQRGYSTTPSPGPHALAVAPGDLGPDELLRRVDHGLFVTSMTGLHSGVNPVSGDFSVGVDGLMVRNGELAEPVREATVASTLQRLLLDVEAVGSDLEWQPGGTGGVTVVIPDVMLSGA
jgi:PmbA protein